MGSSSARCFHCGESLPLEATFTASVGDRSEPVCCIGCKAACEWIGTLGLADYYRLRETVAPRVLAAAGDLTPWDRDELQRLYVHRYADGTAEVNVLIEGLRCSACSWLIERALAAVDGVCEVGVNLTGKRARIVWQPQRMTLSAVLAAITRLGYTPHPLDRKSLDEVAMREQRDALKRLVVAGLGMMQAMMFAIVLYAGALEGMDVPTRDFFRWVGLIVTIPVVSYAAWPFFRGARREWRARRPGMDTPVALAVALVFVASAIETVRGGAHVYFDSASMFVFLLLGGRYLEMRARHRAAELVDALARLQPAIAERRNASGAIESVGVHELETGDCVVIADGATVPADGELSSAECHVDESLLSGESKPVRRYRGDKLIAGSIVSNGPVDMHVERMGADTILSAIVRLAGRARQQRPRWASYGERAAGYFVLALLGVAAATAAAWYLVDPSRAFPATLAVLVVACPCAFALSVPAALARALAVLARRGVFVLKPNAIENLARTDHFIFDKTGTLTNRAIQLVTTAPLTQRSAVDCLAIAAQLEAGNTHPIAEALRAAGTRAPSCAMNLRSFAGFGVEGEIKGRRYRLGSTTFALGKRGISDSDDVVLADATGALACFTLRENLREDAASTLAALREQHAGVEILSGDSASRVAAIAARLGVETFRARVSPQRKLDRLQQLRVQGKVVGVVGDGVNDAPILAGADLAVALGGGAELAQSSADIVLANDRLSALVEARTIAAITLRIMRQNIIWALIYNSATIPLAATGWIPPWLAAIGMSLSSLAVVLNALRIKLPHPDRRSTRTGRSIPTLAAAPA